MKHNYNIFTKQELAGFLRDPEKDFFYTVSPFDILIERKMDNVMKEIRKNIECGGLLLDKFNQTKDIEDFKPIMDRNDEYSKLMKEYDRLGKLRFPKEEAYENNSER